MNESHANPDPPAEPKHILQFSLRSLFHLCCFASAFSLAAEGVISGKPGKVLLPLSALGACYAIIVAYRLRKTIARFAWDLANFYFSWLFLVAYLAIAGAYLHSLQGPSWYSIRLVRGMAIGLAPVALWAAYRTAFIYWRAKFEPEDDYC